MNLLLAECWNGFSFTVRREESIPYKNSTTAVLADLLHCRVSPTAQAMINIVSECSGQDPLYSGRYLADLYRQLSGHVHHQSWCGPGILISPRLDAAQKCVLRRYAQDFEDFEVNIDTLEEEQEAAEEEAEEEDDQNDEANAQT